MKSEGKVKQNRNSDFDKLNKDTKLKTWSHTGTVTWAESYFNLESCHLLSFSFAFVAMANSGNTRVLQMLKISGSHMLILRGFNKNEDNTQNI